MKKRIAIIVSVLLCFLVTPNINKIYAQKNNNPYEKMVENILLVGKDKANESSISRSDSMIILTIDNLNKCLKLTSLSRDTLVDIPGKGYDKLNHAYAYGGIDLLLETINNNLDMNIKNYAIVDFSSFIEIIDIIGGVNVEVKENEISNLNSVIKSCYNIDDRNENIKYITTSGKQCLNGYQALAYARIRKMDTIYKRDERQRAILTDVANQLSNTSISNYLAIIKNVARNVDVNVPLNKLLKMAYMSHELATYEIKQMQFPQKEYREEATLNGSFVVDWDKNKGKENLHQFIYMNQ